MLWSNQWTNICGGMASWTHPELLCFLDTTRGKLIRNRTLNENPLGRQANLSAISVAGPNGGAGGDVEVSIGEDQHGVFAAEFENRGDQASRAGLRHATARGHTAGEKNFVGVGIDQGLADLPATLNDGHKIFRKTRIGEELANQCAALGSKFTGFADHGVACGNRGDDLPQWNG